MASLYISEYAVIGLDGKGQIQAEPSVTTQKVTFTGTAAASSAFAADTCYISIVSDSIFSYTVGTNPTATTSHMYVALGVEKSFSVPKGQSYKISAIVNT